MPSEASSSSTQPLLSHDHDEHELPLNSKPPLFHQLLEIHNYCRPRVQSFLSSRAQHYTVLALVSCDLLGIFADIIINLFQCDAGATDPKWNDVRTGLGIAGLVFSCLFMLELIASVWAFGLQFVAPFFFEPAC